MTPGGALDSVGAAGETLARAVTDEHNRVSRQIGAFRLFGITCFVALIGSLNFFMPGWIGGFDRLLWYWLAAAVVFGATRLSSRIAHASGLAIPLVDMPMLYFVLSGIMKELQATPYAADARGVALMAGIFYVVLVFLASFSLRDGEIYLAVAAAVLLEGPLLRLGGGDWTVIPAVELGIVLAGALAIHANRRTRRFVHAVAAEQLFLSPEIARAMHERGLQTVMRQDRVLLSVIACDLRGFTAFSEAAAAEEVMQLLTGYYDVVGRAVTEFGGTIKDHAGDGVLCLVGAPVAHADHAARAIGLALALRERGTTTLAAWRRLGLDLGLGIGVASGYVTVGAIRGATRLEYVAVGPAVTLASRLCQFAESGRILVDQRTVGLLGEGARGRRIEARGTTELKGFARPTPLFELVA
jgi:class 3 adenylate cyclase